MSKLADQPAFPGIESSHAAVDSYNNSYTGLEVYYGMTLRQHFAGLAMHGILANAPMMECIGTDDAHAGLPECAQHVALLSTVYADALIAALEKTP